MGPKDKEKQKIIEFMNNKLAASQEGMEPALADPQEEPAQETMLMAKFGESPELPLAQTDRELIAQMQGAEIGKMVTEAAQGRPVREIASPKAKREQRPMTAAEKRKQKEVTIRILKQLSAGEQEFLNLEEKEGR